MGGTSRSQGEMDFTNFEITIKLTLAVKRTTNAFGAVRTVIDLMSWIDELPELTDPVEGPVERIALIEKDLHVSLTTSSGLDPVGYFRQGPRNALFTAVSNP